jgi:hypothetical protein
LRPNEPQADAHELPCLEEKLLHPQRAVRSLALRPLDLALGLACALSVDALALAYPERIFAFWGRVMRALCRLGGLAAAPDAVSIEPWVLAPRSGVRMPTLELSASGPGTEQWCALAAGTVLVAWAASSLPQRLLPVSYVIRFLCLVQGISLAFFAWDPASYSYDIVHFARTELNVAYVLLLFLPLVIAFTFFTLEFPARKKLGLLGLVIGHLLVAAPVAVVACGALTQLLSLAVLPVFYLTVFPMAFVAWFVGFYSWAMSWRAEPLGRPHGAA